MENNQNPKPAKPSAGKAKDVSSAKPMQKPMIPDNQPNDNFRPGERSGQKTVPGRDKLGE